MIVEHLIIGGIYFMLPIYLIWVTVIYLSVKFLVAYKSENIDLNKLNKLNSVILFLGSFAFLLGLFAQILGLYGALISIQAAGDISPALMAGGLRISFLAPLYGFGIFLISGIVWFVFRNLIRK
ncbi:MAG: MotA/TolQ/ExbB proton channel family protein [Bacteroidales bacterium]|nr:MotA/TolQ/ExbB proton channel family protein [Bacteroidales bacterium]